MSLQQLNSDTWTNKNLSPWGGGNALAVSCAQANVYARTALIIRGRAQLDEAIAAPATPVSKFLINVAWCRFGKEWELLQR